MAQPEEERSSMENAVLGLYVHAAQRIKQGATHDEIESELIDMGLNTDTAKVLLARLDESRENVARRNGYRNTFIGGVVMVMALSLISGVFGSVAHTAVQIMLFVVLFCGVYALVRGIMQILNL